MITGTIFDIKRFSLHDGPGLRTTVFFKGCRLHCPWCHNPEGIAFEQQLLNNTGKCISCGRCMNVCRLNAIRCKAEVPGVIIDADLCNSCGDCVGVCPTEALCMAGYRIGVSELLKEIGRDKVYYSVSGGGVTLSGGEPLLQPEFASLVLKKSREAGIHTAIETSLSVPRKNLEKVTYHSDLVIVDIKIFDPLQHRKLTGRSNRTILENFTFIAEHCEDILLRIPVIPGYTDNEENIRKIGEFILSVRKDIPVELLRYNTLAEEKYKLLNKPFPLGSKREGQIAVSYEDCREIAKETGLSLI